MPKGSYSSKQRKLAAVAPPRDKITAADLKKLRSKKKRKEKEVKLTPRQKTLLANTLKGTHSAKHMDNYERRMRAGRYFYQAHKKHKQRWANEKLNVNK